MQLFEDFKIDGNPMPVPDAEVDLSHQDLDAGSTGRDESGVMHRVRIRSRVKTWEFQYSNLDKETFSYLEDLLSQNDVFTFTYPDKDGKAKECQCYCTKTSISYRNTRTGMFSNYKFSINEC